MNHSMCIRSISPCDNTTYPSNNISRQTPLPSPMCSICVKL
uniref:Uncharacterized protein n=1 Tax=Rhizophora mucronata TaxID=61149 RepID=A0A2P2JYP4_RHIMU